LVERGSSRTSRSAAKMRRTRWFSPT
jgi:hypothetical protein